MINKKKISIIIFYISIFLQGISILQYLLDNNEQYVFNWVPQYIILVCLSILFTFFQYVFSSTKQRYILFFIRFIILLIIHFSIFVYMGLKQFFLIAFLLDLSYLISFPINLILSTIAFLSIYSIGFLNLHAKESITKPDFLDRLTVIVSTLLFIVIFTFFKIFSDSYNKTNKRITLLNDTIKKLTDANTGFQHYINIVKEESITEERNRIIREIHDSLGYTLTTIRMLAASIFENERAHNKTENQVSQEAIQNISMLAKNGLNDMRIVLRLLKRKNEKVESDSLKLYRMITAFQRATNVKVNINFGNAPNNFFPEISQIIFRLVQEGMINALRHGMATQIDISLHIQDNILYLTIYDNGTGFKSITPGIGLLGIKERLEEYNGTVSISNTILGVKLSIALPLGDKS